MQVLNVGQRRVIIKEKVLWVIKRRYNAFSFKNFYENAHVSRITHIPLNYLAYKPIMTCSFFILHLD